jgi:hypothetical protein
MTVGEVLVLVEGYDDRAFWAGYLQRVRGCVASVDIGNAQKIALGSEVRRLLQQVKGTYTYLTPSHNRVVRVVPYQERRDLPNPLWTLFDEAITGRATRPERTLAGVVVCRDDDGQPGEAPRHRREHLVDRLTRLGEVPLREHDPHAVCARLGEVTVVLPVTWRCDDPQRAALPDKQTLERVVCAALNDVVPDRVRSARTWLAGRPDPLAAAADHKASAGALWAGWHAGDGWPFFHEQLRATPDVRDALLRRLPVLASAEVASLFA